MERLILASASPRRREICEKLGLAFDVVPALGEEPRLCYKFSSMLGYEIVSNSRDTAAILHER